MDERNVEPGRKAFTRLSAEKSHSLRAVSGKDSYEPAEAGSGSADVEEAQMLRTEGAAALCAELQPHTISLVCALAKSQPRFAEALASQLKFVTRDKYDNLKRQYWRQVEVCKRLENGLRKLQMDYADAKRNSKFGGAGEDASAQRTSSSSPVATTADAPPPPPPPPPGQQLAGAVETTTAEAKRRTGNYKRASLDKSSSARFATSFDLRAMLRASAHESLGGSNSPLTVTRNDTTAAVAANMKTRTVSEEGSTAGNVCRGGDGAVPVKYKTVMSLQQVMAQSRASEQYTKASPSLQRHTSMGSFHENEYSDKDVDDLVHSLMPTAAQQATQGQQPSQSTSMPLSSQPPPPPLPLNMPQEMRRSSSAAAQPATVAAEHATVAKKSQVQSRLEMFEANNKGSVVRSAAPLRRPMDTHGPSKGWKLTRNASTDLSLLTSGDTIGKPPRSGNMQSPQWMETLRHVVVCQCAVRAFLARRAHRRRKTRLRISEEILSTELSYAESLQNAATYYLGELRDSSVVDASTLRCIFSELESICVCSVAFLQELQNTENTRATDTWGAKYNDIAGAFETFVPMMKCYREYVNNYDVSLYTIATNAKKNLAFRATLKKAKETCNEDLDSILIKPVQRIPRYTLLLRDLLKYSPAIDVGTAHATRLEKILGSVTALADDLNTSKREAEFGVRARCINEAFSPREREEIDIIQAHRRLVAEGDIQYHPEDSKQLQDCYLILLSDLLLVVKREERKKTNLSLSNGNNSSSGDVVPGLSSKLQNVTQTSMTADESPARVHSHPGSSSTITIVANSRKNTGTIRRLARTTMEESLKMVSYVELQRDMSVTTLQDDTESDVCNGFMLDTVKRTFFFKAPDAGQRTEWIARITQTLSKL